VFALAWVLSEASWAFLGALPARWCARVGGLRVLAAHARPGNDTRGIAADTPDSELVGLLDASAADVLLVGHTHAPFARALRDGRLVCNPGALLRDPAPGFDLVTPGTFGVLTVAGGSAAFEVRRAADGALVEFTVLASLPRRLRPQPQLHQVVVLAKRNISQAVDAAQGPHESTRKPRFPEELVRKARRSGLRSAKVSALGVGDLRERTPVRLLSLAHRGKVNHGITFLQDKQAISIACENILVVRCKT